MKQTVEQEEIIDSSNSDEPFYPGVLSITGPIFVLLTILLLVVKESPYYIDLAAVAIVGLLLNWRFSLPGFLISNSILMGVIAYDVFVEGHSFGLWDAGVVATLEFAFVLTLLSGKELFEQIQVWGGERVLKLQEKEQKLAEVLAEQQHAEKRLKEAQALATQKSGIAEQFERLLKMAREELHHEIKKREDIETHFFEQKREISKLQEKLEDTVFHTDQIQQLRGIIDQKEHELFSLKASMQQTQSDSYDSGKILELEQTIEQLSFEKNGIESSYNLLEKNFEDLDKKYHEQAAIFHENEEKIQDLADRLQKLTDRLKEVQKEKDEIEKQLDQAIQPSETAEVDRTNPLSRELRRVEGLYFQLREQFEEKKFQLDQTRHELFHLQEELLLKVKETASQEEESFILLSKEYKKLLNRYLFDIAILEEQVAKDEDLIASLSQSYL